MLTQIVSGGQTGADRAALDVAIKFNIPHGGWIARGRRTEDGPLPEVYRLREMAATDYPSRTRQNIIDSHGTAVISRGRLTGGSKLTRSFARVKGRPNCHIDVAGNDTFEAAIILQSFVQENQIRVLNVAGPRASHDPGIYFDVKSIMETMLYLDYLDSGAEDSLRGLFPRLPEQHPYPGTLDAAVEAVSTPLSLKAKALVARMATDRVMDLYFAWMDDLRTGLGLEGRNSGLLSCLARDRATGQMYTAEDAVMDVVKALKSDLTDRYRPRILK